ncbi:GIY-YIG nuclease family protein [Fibrella aestuarina]|uniref:GIY-YIG nuclease family protein n=1 Tax=Fibrella aestuarina TaxID=651143 RepID=UPI00059EB383|nr:GIY-YIG nuclease family protein [Fibrella aestuarina]
MSYVVYIVYSDSLQKFYIGQTVHLGLRLEEHNRGKGNFTAKGHPWRLIASFNCETRTEAVQLELKIKGRGAKRYLQDIGLQE